MILKDWQIVQIVTMLLRSSVCRIGTYRLSRMRAAGHTAAKYLCTINN